MTARTMGRPAVRASPAMSHLEDGPCTQTTSHITHLLHALRRNTRHDGMGRTVRRSTASSRATLSSTDSPRRRTRTEHAFQTINTLIKEDGRLRLPLSRGQRGSVSTIPSTVGSEASSS